MDVPHFQTNPCAYKYLNVTSTAIFLFLAFFYGFLLSCHLLAFEFRAVSEVRLRWFIAPERTPGISTITIHKSN